jgi:hypothetical protein
MELIKNLKTIRQNLCCYSPGQCDCKYDPELHAGMTEHTGCPEIREVIVLLENMSDNDFSLFAAKGDIIF